MEVEITEKGKKEMRFKLKGEGHGFSNLLVKTLQEMEGVEIAQYNIEHPELSEPDFYLKTKKDPEKMVKKACDKIKEQMENLKGQI